MRARLSEYHVVGMNFVLLAALAYFAALTVNDFVARRLIDSLSAEPAAPAVHRPVLRHNSRAAYATIAQRDVFNSVKETKLAPAPVATDLHIKLLGTSQLTRDRPFAVIEDDSRQQALYRLGDEIPDAGRLVAVEKKRVIIHHEGRNVALEIGEEQLTSERPSGRAPSALAARLREKAQRRQEQHRRRSPRGPRAEAAPRSPLAPGGVHQVADNQYVVDRSTVDQDMKNMGELLTQVRAIPNIENGKTTGFRLSEIQAGSLFQQMGLQDGDIVQSVGGQNMNDPTRALELLSLLQNQKSVAVQVLRNGQPVRLNYQIH